MARILMVSKPIAPPWNDSSKNLVRDIASYTLRHHATVMTQRGDEPPLRAVTCEPVYGRRTSRFAPALRDNAQVLLRLLTGSRHDIWHFFFAPNPRSSAAGRLAARARRVRTVQTVCSAPRAGVDLPRLLFADLTVVLSRYTEAIALRAGVPPDTLRCIAPAVAPLEPPAESDLRRLRLQFGLAPESPLIVYPGDLEVSQAAERMLRAHVLLQREHGAQLALACRAKTPRAREHEQRLRALAHTLGIESSVRFIGETPQIHGLLAAAEVVALPAEDLYAKMDLPLVLIEAMLLGRAVVVAEGTPAAELCDGDAAVAVPADADAVAHAISGLLRDPQGRAQLGARARAAALARHHPAVVASAYEALYDELLR